jgi:hypothetical protein
MTDITDLGCWFWVLGFIVWLLMLWALRAGLDRVEASLEARARQARDCDQEPHPLPGFDQPESVGEIIGRYMDAPIYGDVTIRGRKYRFDRVQPPELWRALGPNEGWLAPGIVYVALLSTFPPM